jgi:hypothetical protein
MSRMPWKDEGSQLVMAMRPGSHALLGFRWHDVDDRSPLCVVMYDLGVDPLCCLLAALLKLGPLWVFRAALPPRPSSS